MDVQACLRQLVSSKRILVLGSSGSGKTTFCRCLARLLDLEPIHLDAHFWQPGWVRTAEPEWRARVAALAERPAWIMDGIYEASLDLRIPLADTLIMIESGRLACLWRVLKRKLTADDQNRPDAPPGQPVDRAFLRYVWQYPAVTRPLVYRLVHQYGPNKKMLTLRAPRDLRQFQQAARLHGSSQSASDLAKRPGEATP